jgi:pyrroloquinoline quinone (PQQ) biosynthesis protein C
MSHPVLQFNASVYAKENAAIIEMDDTEAAITGLADSRRVVDFILDMDGRSDLKSLCNQHSISYEIGKNITQELSDSGIVSFVSQKEPAMVDPLRFAKECRTVFKKWKNQLFTDSFWEKLSCGKASIAEFAGWLLENFYFIEGATFRLSLATASSANKQIKKHFSQHFIEEYNHHHFFMKALKRLGFTSEQVEMHQPLPSTLAIINHMRECARRDILSYSMCSAFLESTGEDRSIVTQFFETLSHHYDAEKKGIITPLINHANLDAEYGHNGWLEKICSELPMLDMERANDALQSGKTLVETLQLWSNDIERYYSGRTLNSVINPYCYP